MEKIKINNLSVVECKLIKQLNKEDHVVCFKRLCLLGHRAGREQDGEQGCSLGFRIEASRMTLTHRAHCRVHPEGSRQ